MTRRRMPPETQLAVTAFPAGIWLTWGLNSHGWWAVFCAATFALMAAFAVVAWRRCGAQDEVSVDSVPRLPELLEAEAAIRGDLDDRTVSVLAAFTARLETGYTNVSPHMRWIESHRSES